MASRIQFRVDQSATWISVNPVLKDGEPGFAEDTGEFKIGDGETPWNELQSRIPNADELAALQSSIAALEVNTIHNLGTVEDFEATLNA